MVQSSLLLQDKPSFAPYDRASRPGSLTLMLTNISLCQRQLTPFKWATLTTESDLNHIITFPNRTHTLHRTIYRPQAYGGNLPEQLQQFQCEECAITSDIDGTDWAASRLMLKLPMPDHDFVSCSYHHTSDSRIDPKASCKVCSHHDHHASSSTSQYHEDR